MIIVPTVLLLVFIMFCSKNIRNGIYLIIFSMPLYLWRFSVFGIPTNVLETMIYVLFLVWLVDKIKKYNSPSSRRYSSFLQQHLSFLQHYLSFSRRRESIVANIFANQYKILNLGIALLFAGVFASTIISSDPRTSLGILKGWFVAPFLFFIIFINIINKKEHIISSLKSWFFSGVVISLISMFYLLGNNLTYDGRLNAFYLSPNHLAMYLAPAFLIGLFFLLYKKTFNIQHSIFNILLLIILIPLYFTYSYGVFLGISVAIIYMLAKRKNFKIKKTPALFLVIILFAGLIFISSGKVSQIINSNDRSSFHSRLMIYGSAIEIIKDNLLFGIGPGTFQEAYLSYADRFDEPYLEWAVPQPHNIFLAFYLQTGLIGFIGFILILVWFFNLFRRRHYIMLSSKNYLDIMVMSLMIYTLFHGLIDTTYWKNDLALMFWVVVGIMVVLRKEERDF